jgi:hypothetical protein
MDGDLGEELADIGRREPVVSNDAPVRRKLQFGQITCISGFNDNCAVSQWAWQCIFSIRKLQKSPSMCHLHFNPTFRFLYDNKPSPSPRARWPACPGIDEFPS